MIFHLIPKKGPLRLQPAIHRGCRRGAAPSFSMESHYGKGDADGTKTNPVRPYTWECGLSSSSAGFSVITVIPVVSQIFFCTLILTRTDFHGRKRYSRFWWSSSWSRSMPIILDYPSLFQGWGGPIRVFIIRKLREIPGGFLMPLIAFHIEKTRKKGRTCMEPFFTFSGFQSTSLKHSSPLRRIHPL